MTDAAEELRKMYDPAAARNKLAKAGRTYEQLGRVMRRIKGVVVADQIDVPTVPVTWDELPAFVKARR